MATNIGETHRAIERLSQHDSGTMRAGATHSWIGTVEPMPVHRAVAFLAVDEIQSMGNREQRMLTLAGIGNVVGNGVFMPKNVQVQIGDDVVAHKDGQRFGAVREVHPHELVIDIENFGDVRLAAGAVLAVHDGKVVVDVRKLPDQIQSAVRHAHDLETQ